MRQPRFVAGSIQVSEALAFMRNREEPCLLVGSKDDLVGILTERDLLIKVAGPQAEDRLTDPVSDLMTASPKTLTSDATVLDALSVMSAGGYRHIPIVDEGIVKGVVSVTDVVDFLVIQFPEEILNPWFDIKPGDAYG